MNADEAWRLQRRWSLVSERTAARLDRWRAVNLGLILIGALIGALSAQDQWLARPVTVTLGVVSASALSVAGIIQGRRLTADRTHARVAARAASEALQGVVYQYLAGVAPFAGPDREVVLGAKVTEVERLLADRASLVMGVAPDTEEIPSVAGVADYVRERAERQRDWHDRRAADHLRRAGRWEAAELVATTTAAVLAAAGGAWHGPDLSAWVAVATTAGAAFAAHLAGHQHDKVADSYARTVLGLSEALRRFDAGRATPAEAADFVAQVEQILAAQNEAWVGLFSSGQ